MSLIIIISCYRIKVEGLIEDLRGIKNDSK